MSLKKIDNYISYELIGNQLKVRITDKYFSMYSFAFNVLEACFIIQIMKTGNATFP